MPRPRMSQFLIGPGADDLGEEGDADAHQLARLAAGEGFAILRLLVAQARVVDGASALSARRDSRR